MNIENMATKQYIKSLPPRLAVRLIEEYKIPSPQKEVLIVICVEKKPFFSAIERLASMYGINLSFWQVGYRLREGLEMFRKAHRFAGKDFSSQLQV